MGLVRGGVESESDVVVGISLEVRLYRFEKSKNGGRKTGKDGGICKKTREESESDVAVRVPLEVRLHRFKKR